MKINTLFTLILMVMVLPGVNLAQDAVRMEFEKVYKEISGYEDSEYKQKILEVVKFLDKHPKYSPARGYLYQLLGNYKNKIRYDDDILTESMKHFDSKSPLSLELYLAYFYRLRDRGKVDEILTRIINSSVPPKFSLQLLLDYDMNIDRELFNYILSNIYPFISFESDYEKYLYYYISGQILLLSEVLNDQPAKLPYKILGKIDPDIFPDVYIKYFSQSLPSDPKVIIDSVSNTTSYLNICKQYLAAGNTEAYNYIKNRELDNLEQIDDIYRKCKVLYQYKELDQYGYLIKKIYNSITPSDTMLSTRLYWGISCLELNQIYKAEQFLSYLFTYCRDSESAYYKNELEWWAGQGLRPEWIRKLLSDVFGVTYAVADTSKKQNPAPEEKKYAPLKYTALDTTYGTYHALLIAVQDYQDSLIQDLRNPLNDAKNLRSVLQGSYNFDESNITLLENPGRQDIFNSLSNYSSTLSENDNLLIFYAGHGTWNDEIRQGYWIPADASLQNQSRWITNTTLCDMIAMIKSRHTLLISDACFSGAIFKQRDVKEFNMNKAAEEVYKHPSRKAITSGTLKEVPDESIFIKKLLRKLEENKEKYLFAENLYFGIKKEVINQSSQVPLYGPLLSVGDEEKGDFIFVKK